MHIIRVARYEIATNTFNIYLIGDSLFLFISQVCCCCWCCWCAFHLLFVSYLYLCDLIMMPMLIALYRCLCRGFLILRFSRHKTMLWLVVWSVRWPHLFGRQSQCAVCVCVCSCSSCSRRQSWPLFFFFFYRKNIFSSFVWRQVDGAFSYIQSAHNEPTQTNTLKSNA